MDLALKPYIDSEDDLNDEMLSKIIDLKPIIGKRHYIETGNFRFLKIIVKTFEEFSNYVESSSFDENGEIIICLPSKNEIRLKVKDNIEKSLRSVNTPLAVSLPNQANKIIKLLKKLSALELVQQNNEVLQIDKIARKEVANSIDIAKKEIEFFIENLLFETEWFVTSYNKNNLKKCSDIDINNPQTLKFCHDQ